MLPKSLRPLSLREACADGTPPPPLSLNDRVVWFSDSGPEYGVVRWLGKLPDVGNDWMAGVDFDHPVGSGTGLYNDYQLFETKMCHASLVPVIGLMKAEDFLDVDTSSTSNVGNALSSSAKLTQDYNIVSGHHLQPIEPPQKPRRIKVKKDKLEDSSSTSSSTQYLPEINSLSSHSSNLNSVPLSKPKRLSTNSTQTATPLSPSPSFEKTVTDGTSTSWSSLNRTQHLLNGNLNYNDIEIGSVVEVMIYSTPKFGIVKWIGTFDDSDRYDENKLIAGIEMEEECVNCSDGVWNGVRYFDCAPRRGFFVKLSQCKRQDSRQHTSTAADRRRSPLFPNIDPTPVQLSKPKRITTTVIAPSQPSRATISGSGDRNSSERTLIDINPPSSNRASQLMNGNNNYDIDIGSVVEVVIHSTPKYGIVKWIGTFNDIDKYDDSKLVAGIELEEECVGSTDGVWKGKRIFDCAPGRGCFVKLSQCRKDNRFSSLDRRQSNLVDIDYPSDKSLSKLKRSTGTSTSATNSLNKLSSSALSPTTNERNLVDESNWTTASIKSSNSSFMISDNPNLELEIGSVVEVIVHSVPRYGVIRWIGTLSDPDNKFDENSKVVAGIEMEEECPGGNDGVWNGIRYFDCAPGRGYFIKLSQCKKDSRFSSVQERRKSALFGSIDCPTVTGYVPPLTTPDDLQALCGKNRGIQGHHNSCYLDATLFAMFSCTNVFESLLHRPPRSDDIPEYRQVQRVLKEEIVNPLRANLYVRADRVMHLRTLLEKISSVRGLTSEEKDPEEFLNILLNEILKAEPYLKLSSGLESFFYQIFVEKDEKLALPTVQQLFDQSFLASDIKLREIPPCLLIQMPRFGRQFKMYQRIIPSLYLDITDVLENSARQCIICGQVAEYECKECYGSFGDGLDSIAFCPKCMEKSHSHIKRSKHKTTRLNVPSEFQKMKDHTQVPRIYMELFAVLCIETR